MSTATPAPKPKRKRGRPPRPPEQQQPHFMLWVPYETEDERQAILTLTPEQRREALLLAAQYKEKTP